MRKGNLHVIYKLESEEYENVDVDVNIIDKNNQLPVEMIKEISESKIVIRFDVELKG